MVLGEEDEGKDAEFIGDHRKDGLRNSKFDHSKNIENKFSVNNEITLNKSNDISILKCMT